MKTTKLSAVFAASILLLSACGQTNSDESLLSSISETDGLEMVQEMNTADSTSSSAEVNTASGMATAVDQTSIEITAQSAVLYDCKSKTILASKNADNLVYPASTVKLMTSLIAVENVPLNTVVTVGDELNLLHPHSSLAYLAKGQQLTMNDLLRGMLIPSGNDAAYVTATYTGRILAKNPGLAAQEAVAVFVEEMNKKAAELGMKNTTYTSPDGFDDNSQQTTAEDLAKLSAEVVTHPEITAITKLHEYAATFVSGQVITWTNTNEMLDPENPYYIPACIGLKTGSTEYSGYCITSAYEYKGQQYVIVILNGGSETRWADSNRLYNYLTSHF